MCYQSDLIEFPPNVNKLIYRDFYGTIFMSDYVCVFYPTTASRADPGGGGGGGGVNWVASHPPMSYIIISIER